MKSTQKGILLALSLSLFVGALVFTTSCGPQKHKIDASTVLPFKDKAELDSLLDFPLLPEYTIEEYYTKTDFVHGDEQFVVCCKFKEEVPRYMLKHLVRPGITGWAQVNGLRGDTSIPQRIRFDIYYIEHWSIWLDLKILFRTVFGGKFKNDEE